MHVCGTEAASTGDSERDSGASSLAERPLILSGRVCERRAAQINGTTFASYSVIGLECNIGNNETGLRGVRVSGLAENRGRGVGGLWGNMSARCRSAVREKFLSK